MDYSSKIELDEFDEMAFGLGPDNNSLPHRDNPLNVLSSRDPPPLRIAAKAPSTAPAAGSATTKIPLDGLGFSDDDDDLFPAFQPSSRPKTSAAPVNAGSIADRLDNSRDSAIHSTRSLGVRLGSEKDNDILHSSSHAKLPPTPSIIPTVSVFDRLKSEIPKPDEVRQSSLSVADRLGPKTVVSSSSLTTNPPSNNSTPSTDTPKLTVRAPVQSTLFKNLTRPSWNIEPSQPTTGSSTTNTSVQTPVEAPLPPLAATPLSSQAEAERQRRAMLFGGSTGKNVDVQSIPLSSSAAGDIKLSTNSNVTPKSNELLNQVLVETKNAEEEDLRRVRNHHEFIRQQTQQAVQLQQAQADEFLRQYLAENQTQLNLHLHKLRSGFSLARPVSISHAAGDGSYPQADEDPLSHPRTAILVRKLEEKDARISEQSKQMLFLDEQHREETRVIRAHYDEALQRAAQIHHEYVLSLLGSHESVRKQYEEALEYLRESTSSKSSLEAVRSTVEQSARDIAVWRSELESRHANIVREKESQLYAKDQRMNELTELLERQNTNSATEREALQRRIQEDATRLSKRQLEVEEQAYSLNRERTDFEAERTRFHNTQAKELQRLEKRLDEALKERQETSEYIEQEKHALELDKRKLADTIRQAEDKYALEYRKKQLDLESEKEAVVAEKKLIEEKVRNLAKEEMLIKAEREHLETNKQDERLRKTRLDHYNEELARRDSDLEQTILRVAKMKRDGELALQEAKFLDEEHKIRVIKFNVFLEQLRDKELNLMRQAVESDVDGKQRAIQLPNGTLTVIPHRHTGRMQILPNPARDDKFWQGERDYLQVQKSTPWITKN